MEIKKLDIHCEHRCIVGHSVLNEPGSKNHMSLIYDGDRRLVDDSFQIILYNFCPGCGQELTLDFKNRQTEISIRFKKQFQKEN